MSHDYTKSARTRGGVVVVFVEDRGHGEYPLIFDLFCGVKRTWFAQMLYSRDGKVALSFGDYDLAPPPRGLAPPEPTGDRQIHTVTKAVFGAINGLRVPESPRKRDT